MHGGDPHVVLAIHNDPLFEVFMGLRPEPPSEQLDCRGTLVVGEGVKRIAWRDTPVAEPDWDEAARTAVMDIA